MAIRRRSPGHGRAEAAIYTGAFCGPHATHMRRTRAAAGCLLLLCVCFPPTPSEASASLPDTCVARTPEQHLLAAPWRSRRKRRLAEVGVILVLSSLPPPGASPSPAFELFVFAVQVFCEEPMDFLRSWGCGDGLSLYVYSKCGVLTPPPVMGHLSPCMASFTVVPRSLAADVSGMKHHAEYLEWIIHR